MVKIKKPKCKAKFCWKKKLATTTITTSKMSVKYFMVCPPLCHSQLHSEKTNNNSMYAYQIFAGVAKEFR